MAKWAIAAIVAVSMGTLLTTDTAAAADARPNVLLVYTDDQRFDTIRALGNPEISTPTLDALVARGFSFSNAYCQGGQSPAVCVPSRVMLLTGKSTFRTPPYRAENYAGATLGKTFRAAGYATACISKPGNSFPPAHRAFETVVNVPHSGATTNQKAAEAAMSFLASAPNDRPFFLYFAPSMPHDPRTADPKYHAQYDPSKLSLSKNFRDQVPVDFGVLGIRDEKLAAYPRQTAEMQRHLADYYACITELDHYLGRILATLAERGQLDRTIVLFSSDQGLAVGGRHGLMGKQNLYEHFKSPLILAGPGVRQGTSAALVYLHDIYPTLCDLANIPTPADCDGASLAPVMTGRAHGVRESLFAVYLDTQRMVRDARWKLIWYPKIDRSELFDLEADPDELANLADRPEHAADLMRLRLLMAEAQTRYGDDKAPRHPIP